MPNSVRGPTLTRKEALVTVAFNSGGKVAIRLASNDNGTFNLFEIATLTGSTNSKDGTYFIQSYGNDPTGDFLITTTNYTGADGAGGTLTGIFKPANKITADTSNSMDMRETSGGVFQIASRSSGSGTGNTLDGAYDQGGSGSGRSINANNGAVTITGTGNNAVDLRVDGNNNALTVTSVLGTNATEPVVEITQDNLTNNETPAVRVRTATTGNSLADKFIVNNNGIIGQGETNEPQIIAQSDTGGDATIGLRTNSLTSSLNQNSAGALTISGNASATLTSPATSVASTGGAVALSATGGVVHVNGGTGFCSGDVPATINTHSASIGITHTASVERSLVIGQSNTAQDDSLAVGESCTAQVNSMALGNQANSTHYTSGHVLVMAANNDAGGPSPNTLVLDAGNAIPAHPAAAIAPPVAPTGVGNVYLDTGGVYSGGADYAEMFEWNDGNVNSADRRGLFVSLVNGNKLSVGGSNVIGVVSSSPVVIGDAAELSWHGKYERDEFGGIVYQTIDGMRRPKPSTSYIPTQTYTPRRMRKEWAPIGLVGKLHVRSAQALTAGNKCSANSSGYAVSGNDYHILRVIRQPTSTLYGIIEILMK